MNSSILIDYNIKSMYNIIMKTYEIRYLDAFLKEKIVVITAETNQSAGNKFEQMYSNCTFITMTELKGDADVSKKTN